MEILESIFSLSQSDICRLCGLSNSSGFLIYEKVDAAELTIADLINRYLPIQVSVIKFNFKKMCKFPVMFFFTTMLVVI